MKVDLPASVKARLDPAARFGLRLTLVAVALTLVAIPFTALLLQVLAKGPLTRADGRVANNLNSWVHGRWGVVPTLQAVSFLGRPPLLAVWVLIAVVFLWRRDRRRQAVFAAVTSLGGGIVDTLVKASVNRPRPVVDHPVASALGKSFPSGHAMSATVTYGALLVVVSPLLSPRLRRPAFVATVVLVLAVGCSRLLLGVHFVSDVVGGFVLGLAWLLAAVAVFETWRVEERRAKADDSRRGGRFGRGSGSSTVVPAGGDEALGPPPVPGADPVNSPEDQAAG